MALLEGSCWSSRRRPGCAVPRGRRLSPCSTRSARCRGSGLTVGAASAELDRRGGRGGAGVPGRRWSFPPLCPARPGSRAAEGRAAGQRRSPNGWAWTSPGGVAGVGLWQLRQYGAPLTANIRGTLGLDPLLVAAPAIGLSAAPCWHSASCRCVAEVGERLLARGAGWWPRSAAVSSRGDRSATPDPRCCSCWRPRSAPSPLRYAATWTPVAGRPGRLPGGRRHARRRRKLPGPPLWALGTRTALRMASSERCPSWSTRSTSPATLPAGSSWRSAAPR